VVQHGAEQAFAAGETDIGDTSDDMPFAMLDALAVESDSRMARLRELICERGWTRWTRLAEPSG
jgi:hypothetical protein